MSNYTSIIESELKRYGMKPEKINTMATSLNEIVRYNESRNQPEISYRGMDYDILSGVKEFCTQNPHLMKEGATQEQPKEKPKTAQSLEREIDRYSQINWNEIPYATKCKIYKDDPELYQQLKERSKE